MNHDVCYYYSIWFIGNHYYEVKKNHFDTQILFHANTYMKINFPCHFSILNDFSFDDETAYRYGCHIHSFDPSIKTADHERSANVTFHATGLANFDGLSGDWRMRRLASIREELGHQKVSCLFIVSTWRFYVAL